MTIQGLHHMTLICSNAQHTVDFYTRTLGQRFVKKTVNFDDPGSYHLYFGDELGRPGTAITFFEWPNVPRGAPGHSKKVIAVPGRPTSSPKYR